MKEFVYITHNNESITTLADYVDNNPESVVLNMSVSSFASYSADGKTNVERAWDAYFASVGYEPESDDPLYQSYSEQKQAKESDPGSFKLEIPTVFAVPVANLDDQLSVTASNQEVRQQTYRAFWLEEFNRLQLDSRYVKLNYQSGTLKVDRLEASVWIWSRALNSIIDVSDSLIHVNTLVAQNGGNFAIELAPEILTVIAKQATSLVRSSDFKKKKTQDNSGIFSKNTQFQYDGERQLSHKPFSKKSGEYISIDAQDLIFMENDIVWIRFEALEIEAKERTQNRQSLEVSPDELPGKIYDMIGLVDAVSRQTDPESNSISIGVTGRDLIKLLIDDGIYFFPSDVVGGAYSNDPENRRVEGLIYSKAQYIEKTVGFSLKYLLNALAVISVCPDSLFDPYEYKPVFGQEVEDRRSKFYQLSERNSIKKNSTLKRNDELILEINEIIGQNVDINILGIVSTESMSRDLMISSTYNGLQEWFRYMYDNNLIVTSLSEANATQQNLVVKEHDFNDEHILAGELDPFMIIERNIPSWLVAGMGWNVNSSGANWGTLQADMYEKVANDATLVEVANSISQLPMKGIWQIVKLVVDSNIDGFRIIDQSIGNEMGSLLNAVNKWCKPPFIEFFTDTYADQFYLIARRPPFDFANYNGGYETEVRIDNSNVSAEIKKNFIVEIDGSEVLAESLNFNQGEVYSWYRLIPKGMIEGNEAIIYAYMKAVRFKQYAEIWGEKALDIVTNYVCYQPLIKKDLSGTASEQSASTYVRQAVIDLKYLIEINAYMPFVRTGSITITGDRRFKRGSFFKYAPTQEIFYIESVTQDVQLSDSIERTTTLQVSRGMVEKHIDKYFKIIDMPLDALDRDDASDGTVSVTQNWRVNDEIFDFFIQKQQFHA